MKVLVGLGNPGDAYTFTRHNMGFIVIDALHQDFNFPPYKQKYHGAFSEGLINGEKILLLKPTTYMNRSGIAVNELAAFYKIPLSDIFVFYDDIDLHPGKLRLKQDGGHGGHNGIKSIYQHVGSAFWRCKIGVGRPSHSGQDVSSHVLAKFKSDDKKWIEALCQEICYYAPELLGSDPNLFTSKVMQQMQDIIK